MDMGGYMANQMDEQIERGLQQMEQEWEELAEDITKHIKECGYTWTVEDIVKQYRKSRNGFYISHTVREIIEKFSDRLSIFYS